MALITAACSSSDDAGPVNSVPPTTEAVETTSTSSTTTASTTTSTTSSSTTTATTTTTTAAPPEGTDEEQIAAVIEAFWRTALTQASNPPDPAAELWTDIVIPPLLPALEEIAQRNLDTSRGIDGLDPESPFVLASHISVIDQLAIVYLCLRDESRIYDVASGETDKEISIVSLKRMEVLNGERGWLVRSSETVEDFEQG